MATSAFAQETDPVSTVLIANANVLNTSRGRLVEGRSVLIEGNKISKIAKSIPAPDGATVIDAKGRTLMPGLIDAHVHLSSHVDYREEDRHHPGRTETACQVVHAGGDTASGHVERRQASVPFECEEPLQAGQAGRDRGRRAGRHFPNQRQPPGGPHALPQPGREPRADHEGWKIYKSTLQPAVLSLDD